RLEMEIVSGGIDVERILTEIMWTNESSDNIVVVIPSRKRCPICRPRIRREIENIVLGPPRQRASRVTHTSNLKARSARRRMNRIVVQIADNVACNFLNT